MRMGTVAVPTGRLRVQVGDDVVVLETVPGTSWMLGRGSEALLRLTDLRVGRAHLRLSADDHSWSAEDQNSLNGTWLNGHQVRQVRVAGAMTLVLGGPDGIPVHLVPLPPPLPPLLPPPAAPAVASRPLAPPIAPPVAPPTAQPVAPPIAPPTLPLGVPRHARPGGGPLPGADAAGRVHRLDRPVLRIGRAPANDVVLSDLLVSRAHAELRSGPAGAEIWDLDSGNGTYVNGRLVRGQRLAVGDVVTIGPYSLAFTGDRLVERVDGADVAFAASRLAVVLPDGKQLLHDVSFTLGRSALLAVVGPSGAGKSTLLGALTGVRPANAGAVLYSGRNLYAEYDDLRRRIGFVPQQDILHQALTVRQALTYGARLRFPSDTTEAERAARVQEVSTELGLGGQLDTRISRLSGGERKRASTALELLTKPSLLFLDEPTSGLDTDLDREVMKTLRTLADDGRTVVVVTHNLEHLDVCDLVLVLAKGGYVAYVGPPADAFAYFGQSSWADLFALLKGAPGQDWARRFREWPDRDPRSRPPLTSTEPSPFAELTPIRRQPLRAQLVTLARRYLSVIGSDRTLLAIVALLPVLLALVARVVPAPYGLSKPPEPGSDGQKLLLVLVVGAALMGAASSIRELVKERGIYLRERAVGLSPFAYLTSKVLVLGAIAVVQGTTLTLLALAGRSGPKEAVVLGPPLFEIVVAIAALTVVCTLVGLTISALVRDENQAMPLLVLVTMAQLVLSGGLVPLVGRAGLQQISWLVPARWGLAATGSTADLNAMIGPLGTNDPLWHHHAATWLFDMAVLGLLAAAMTVVLLVLTRRLDPARPTGRLG